MLEIPLHGAAQPVLEAVARRPSELAADLRGVDRVASIVAGPIGHERLEPMRAVVAGTELVHEIADAIDDLHVGPLVPAADIILFAHPSPGEREHQPGAMILDVQPVAHLLPVAV